MKKLVQVCVLIAVLTACREKEYDYDFLMNTVLEIKKADKNEISFFDGEPEPSMPDKNLLHSTVLGIDENNNGIRDDIDIWINRTGKNYNERMAMRQYARGEQSFLKAAFEKRFSDAESTMNESLMGYNCLDVIFPSDTKMTLSTKIFHQLGALTAYPNNLRGKIIVGFYKNIISYGGGYGGDESFKNCNFKIENQDEVMRKFKKLSNMQ